MTRNIPFHKAHITEEEIQNVSETLRSGWLTMGPKTLEFEKNFREYLQIPHAISVNSCTSALHLALKAINLQPGDEVILPTNTFVSTAEVITYFNAIPVLCDTEPFSHTINVKLIEKLITSKTKAIIPVHLAGIPCDMDDILSIAKNHNLKVIEDAAHALPAIYKGRKIGTLGDMACFSFYATKTLTTGEGGMVTTPHANYAENITVNRLHGMNKNPWGRYTNQGSWFYEIIDNGYKYNMTDIDASLGLVQLKKLETMWEKRCEIAQKYTSAFQNSPIETPQFSSDKKSAWHLYIIKVNNRNECIKKLQEKGIGCSVHFIPIHQHEYYQKRYGYRNEDYPVANDTFEKSISLPIYPTLSDDDIQYITEKVLEITKK